MYFFSPRPGQELLKLSSHPAYNMCTLKMSLPIFPKGWSRGRAEKGPECSLLGTGCPTAEQCLTPLSAQQCPLQHSIFLLSPDGPAVYTASDFCSSALGNLSASTTPSTSEVKFPISSVCWSSRILRWILYGKKLSALQDVVMYFLHSNLYSSTWIYTRLTYGCHLNENRSPLRRRCKCLSSRTHTHKTNGTEVATQSKKKFKVLCTATAPCTLLMFWPKQHSFGAPARCSGRSIAHPSTQLHPSAIPHRRQHLISLQGCPLGDVLRPERMLPATELLKKNQVEKVGFAF